ncbi:MAG: hypothetical protein ACYS8K_09990, partial [Planctomycetota bacterium]
MAAVTIVLLATASASPERRDRESQGKKAGRGAEVWISIGPEMQDRMVRNKRARAEALLAEAERKVQAAEKIKNGPCRCGAASHEACKTKDVCEPEEDRQMAALRAEAVLAIREREALMLVVTALEAAKDPGRTVARLRAAELGREIDDMEALRAKLQKELGNVRSRSPEVLRLQATGTEVLSVGSALAE